jgi:hypothetical protein
MKFIFIFLLFTSPLFSIDHFVSTSLGNDGNPGSFSQPFKTLTRCEIALQENETCYILGGVYDLGFLPIQVIGRKSFAQYGDAIIDLRLADGSIVKFTGETTSWSTPDLNLVQMLTLGRFGSMPTPNQLIYVELFIDGVLSQVVIGPSLPLELKSPPTRFKGSGAHTFRVVVHF